MCSTFNSDVTAKNPDADAKDKALESLTVFSNGFLIIIVIST